MTITKKRTLPLLALAMALLILCLPKSAQAVDVGTGGEMVIDPSGKLATGNTVYYGIDLQASNAPIKWRVVAKDATSVTLFCDTKVPLNSNMKYSNTAVHENWSGSYICNWLNGTLTTQGLSVAELAAILPYGSDNEYTSAHIIDASQKIVLPSVEEVEDNGAWGMAQADRRIGENWWLRSPDLFAFAWSVNSSGVLAPGNNVGLSNAIRPAFRLDMSSVLFTSAASGASGKSSAAVGGGLVGASTPTGEVKLTVYDTTNLALGSATTTSVSGRAITFGYAGATTGKTLSAVVQSSTGEVKYYGQLATSIPVSGTATVTVPDDFAAGDTLSVFAEDVNGDNHTDYASALQPLSFTNQAAPTGLAGVNCTTSANDDGQITGTTTAMEYSTDGTTWLSCTASTTQNLTPGDYFVRMAASGTSTIASTAVMVTVGADQRPASTGPSFIPTYTHRTLTDQATGVTVSGQMTGSATLSVKQQGLHAEGACLACDEIRARQAAGELIILYDISISGGYTGELEVSIPVGSEYNGQTVTILHCVNGVMESVTCTVENGVAKGTFSKLSPFAVVSNLSTVVETPDDEVGVPQTGDNTALVWLALVWGALLAAVALKMALRAK